MKKKLLSILMLGLVAIGGLGCNTMAKNFGGNIELDLPKGKKLVEITWKDDSLWYVTKNMKEDDIEETYEFKEDSKWGAMEGTVTIHEHK